MFTVNVCDTVSSPCLLILDITFDGLAGDVSRRRHEEGSRPEAREMCEVRELLPEPLRRDAFDARHDVGRADGWQCG